MFDKLLGRVTFEDLVAFCERFPEGVRVEYKREPAHIDKIVASLANTVGGFFVIGVRTDDKNMPVLPIEGMPAKRGIEEQIVQIAHTAIYPALTPAVKILDVSGKDARVVVVVKVAESIDAPHAVDDATKVYVRVGSTTPPYQLADVDRIEYLLKRRQEPERRREEIIQRMVQRSPYLNHDAKCRVVIAPVYPRGVLLPMDELIERARIIQQGSTRLLGDFRLIHNGIRSLGAYPGKQQWYFEANTHGVVFFEEPATVNGELEDWRTKDRVQWVNLVNFTGPLGHVLNTGAALLAGATTNLMIRYEVFGFTGVGFIYGRPDVRSGYIDGGGAVAKEHRCEDAHISVSTIAPLETLASRRLQVSVALLREVLYAFNWQPNDLNDLAETVNAVMKEQRLI